VQILLPLSDNKGRKFSYKKFEKVKKRLTAKFSGLTAYNRSAAEGLWRKRKTLRSDDIVVYEVMVPKLNKSWWQFFKSDLENSFKQESIVIRAQAIKVLR
jgi:hypothetical protein